MRMTWRQWERRYDEAVENDRRRGARLIKGGRLTVKTLGTGRNVQISNVRLSKAGQRFLISQGAAGLLANLLTGDEALRQAYEQGGWLRMILYMKGHGYDTESIFWAKVYAHVGYVVDVCDNPTGFPRKWHVYIRPPFGRRPKACSMHAVAARQGRHRKAHPRPKQNATSLKNVVNRIMRAE
jgi:hypothetical protein